VKHYVTRLIHDSTVLNEWADESAAEAGAWCARLTCDGHSAHTVHVYGHGDIESSVISDCMSGLTAVSSLALTAALSPTHHVGSLWLGI